MVREGNHIFPFRESDLVEFLHIRRGKHGLGQVFRAEIRPQSPQAEPEHRRHMLRLRRHARSEAGLTEKLPRQTSGDIPLAVQKKITWLQKTGSSFCGAERTRDFSSFVPGRR